MLMLIKAYGYYTMKQFSNSWRGRRYSWLTQQEGMSSTLRPYNFVSKKIYQPKKIQPHYP